MENSEVQPDPPHTHCHSETISPQLCMRADMLNVFFFSPSPLIASHPKHGGVVAYEANGQKRGGLRTIAHATHARSVVCSCHTRTPQHAFHACPAPPR